ncbi:MAG: FAD binding domain-containing protein, partial [Anaerolineaceae bacterium]|nr:FAD binding domain-containing protein [Anaerolineaceae bacterium]
MIIEYHRPGTLDVALNLLSRKSPKTVALGGGTVLSRHTEGEIAVVDLQDLPIKQIELQAGEFVIGAAVTLQALIESAPIPAAIAEAAKLETNFNLRQVATIAGALISSNGRSPLTTVLLAMDSSLTWLPGEKTMPLEKWLVARKNASHSLLTQVRIPSVVGVYASFVGRTPADVPLVGVSVCRWQTGRTRITVCGFGETPMVWFDGPGVSGIEAAIEAVRSQIPTSEISNYKLATA